ncbi:MAG: hypothetical protein WBX27_10405 [Specibacter sp.]
MRIRKRLALAGAMAMAALGMMVMAQIASATHPRPKGASPLRASMVPAYNACTAPNRTHGPPLAFPSCNPPVQTSASLTIGSPDANGAAANSVGFVRIAVIVGAPGPPDDSDVKLEGNVTDVRCKAGVAACGSANAADGADYTGELQANAMIRITDHFNAVAPGGGTDPATVIDIPFPVNTPCTATASTAIGSTCAVSTTANAVVPGAVKDTKRAVIETSQITVIDGGTDGVVATTPNTLFGVQGIFIP